MYAAWQHHSEMTTSGSFSKFQLKIKSGKQILPVKTYIPAVEQIFDWKLDEEQTVRLKEVRGTVEALHIILKCFALEQMIIKIHLTCK